MLWAGLTVNRPDILGWIGIGFGCACDCLSGDITVWVGWWKLSSELSSLIFSKDPSRWIDRFNDEHWDSLSSILCCRDVPLLPREMELCGECGTDIPTEVLGVTILDVDPIRLLFEANTSSLAVETKTKLSIKIDKLKLTAKIECPYLCEHT